MHVKIEDDKFRDTDETYREDIDDIFNGLIKVCSKTCPLNFMSISGDRDERISQIKKELSSFIYQSKNESLK
jgi:hypothetical protein